MRNHELWIPAQEGKCSGNSGNTERTKKVLDAWGGLEVEEGEREEKRKICFLDQHCPIELPVMEKDSLSVLSVVVVSSH